MRGTYNKGITWWKDYIIKELYEKLYNIGTTW